MAEEQSERPQDAPKQEEEERLKDLEVEEGAADVTGGITVRKAGGEQEEY